MKLVFAHDHIFYKYKDQYYSTGGLSKKMLERYTYHFDEVVVVSRQKEVDLLDDKLTLASTDNVTFVKVPNFKTIKGYYLKLKASEIIKNEILKSDYLIARNSSIASIAIGHAKKNHIPYMMEVVSCPWDAIWNHSFRGKLLAPYTYYKVKKEIKEAPYVIYVTNEFLQKRYPTNGKHTNCSNVALNDFDEKILNRRLDKIKNKQSGDKIIIGTTATVDVRYKGQQYVIEALSILKKNGISNYEYHLVGGGDQTFLKLMAKKFDVENQVKFLGSMPHNKVFEWLENIDIYCQPSNTEGIPRALIEAMSRGCPSFGSNAGGIPELLDKSFIFKTGNASEIYNVLQIMKKNIMLNQARRNYFESMKYSTEKIDKRRNEFIIRFKEETKQISF
jgi:glycosyltransferase involved in cell wall biosynthesis